MMDWFVYMIRAGDGSLYTGITKDVERRFQEHVEGVRGAKYFHGRTPVAVVYREAGHDRSSASRREAAIKKLRREQKQQLVDGIFFEGSSPKGHSAESQSLPVKRKT